MRRFITDFKSETPDIIETYVPRTIYQFGKAVPYEGVVGLAKFNPPESDDSSFNEIFWKHLANVREYYMIKIKKEIHGIDGPITEFRPYKESLPEYFKHRNSDIGSRIERIGQELLIANHPFPNEGISTIKETLREGASDKEIQLRTIKNLLKDAVIRDAIATTLGVDKLQADEVIKRLETSL